MKKCCITCVFCLKKVKYVQYGFAKVMDNGQKYNLCKEEVVSALNEDFSFLSKEKDSYEKWHNTYAEKKEAKIKKDIAEQVILRLFFVIVLIGQFIIYSERDY